MRKEKKLSIKIIIAGVILALTVGFFVGNLTTDKLTKTKITNISKYSLGYGYAMGLMDMGYDAELIDRYRYSIVVDVLEHYDTMIERNSYKDMLK